MGNKGIKDSDKWIDWIKGRLNEVKKSTEESKDEIKKAYELLESISKQVIELIKWDNWNWAWNIIKELDNARKKILETIGALEAINEKQEENIWIIEEHTDKASSAIRVFHEKINIDQKTGLYNAEYFNNEIELLTKEGKNFSLIFIDLDNLKKINDNYWHQNWDYIIMTFWWLLPQIFWEDKNLCFRIQWDEYAILSIENQSEIKKKLDKLEIWLKNRSIKLTFDWGKSDKIHMSMSYWIATNKEWDNNPSKIFEVADKRMYETKKSKK